jgi:long-subunit fatty acid transport protein
MKNYFLTIILLVIFSSITTAQFNTGSKMVGASSYLDFGFSTEKAKGSEFASKIISININPRAAYFVQNRFAVGGDL